MQALCAHSHINRLYHSNKCKKSEKKVDISTTHTVYPYLHTCRRTLSLTLFLLRGEGYFLVSSIIILQHMIHAVQFVQYEPTLIQITNQAKAKRKKKNVWAFSFDSLIFLSDSTVFLTNLMVFWIVFLYNKIAFGWLRALLEQTLYSLRFLYVSFFYCVFVYFLQSPNVFTSDVLINGTWCKVIHLTE